MKRFLALILALCMVFALCACGGNDDKKPADDDNKDKEPTAITNPDEISDEMTSADGKYEIDADKCIDCGSCADACPVEAPKAE